MKYYNDDDIKYVKTLNSNEYKDLVSIFRFYDINLKFEDNLNINKINLFEVKNFKDAKLLSDTDEIKYLINNSDNILTPNLFEDRVRATKHFENDLKIL